MILNDDGTVTLSQEEAQIAWNGVSMIVEHELGDYDTQEAKAEFDATEKLMFDFSAILRKE